MRRFIDSHLKPKSDSELESMLRISDELGYSAVAAFYVNMNIQNLKKLCDEIGIDLVSRIDIKPNSESELASSLSHNRRRFELVSVECASKAVARKAARDHRVDLISFSPSLQERSKVWFDRQSAALTRESGCAYEINAANLFSMGSASTAKLLAIIRKEVVNAVRYDVNVVLSSGAGTRFQLRDPLSLAALTNLFGMNEEEGLVTISGNPWKIVEENRNKLAPEFIEPGVRLVKKHAC